MIIIYNLLIFFKKFNSTFILILSKLKKLQNYYHFKNYSCHFGFVVTFVMSLNELDWHSLKVIWAIRKLHMTILYISRFLIDTNA